MNQLIIAYLVLIRIFFYSYVKYDIPNAQKLAEIQSISGSISIDPLLKTIRTRCGSIEPNNVTLLLAVLVGNGLVDIREAKRTGLYGKMIKSISYSSNSPKHVKQKAIENNKMYYKKLCELLRQQGNRTKLNPYWIGAFPQGCPE